MPTSGRDVQCSNCGKTWFQHHPDHAPAEEEDVALPPQAPAPDEEVSPPPPPAPPPGRDMPRKQLDPAVADILRQEAEAEFEARKRRQSAPLESQPDLGLESTEEPRARPVDPQVDPDQRALDAKKRMARMRGEPVPKSEAAATAAAMSSRRELLPDIEEINSTLRNDTSPVGVNAETRQSLGAGGSQKQASGFRRGFLTVLALAVLLLVVYLYAPTIAGAIPALDGMLSAYVAAVDGLRLMLDGQIKALLTWLDTVASQSEG